MICKWVTYNEKTYVTVDKEDGRGTRVYWLPYVDNVPVTEELKEALGIEGKVYDAADGA